LSLHCWLHIAEEKCHRGVEVSEARLPWTFDNSS
jgi:hypothetical protein